eukprot:3404216-Prymnesium_polylepis.3
MVNQAHGDVQLALINPPTGGLNGVLDRTSPPFSVPLLAPCGRCAEPPLCLRCGVRAGGVSACALTA